MLIPIDKLIIRPTLRSHYPLSMMHDLCVSIHKDGMVRPLAVIEDQKPWPIRLLEKLKLIKKDQRYIIVDGRARFCAALILGIETIDVFLVTSVNRKHIKQCKEKLSLAQILREEHGDDSPNSTKVP